MMIKYLLVLLIIFFSYSLAAEPINITHLEGGIKENTRITLKGPETILYIRSLGGSVVGTLEILEQIERYPGKLTCIVRDYAASGAAVILLACDKVDIDHRVLVLFHTPRYTVGDKTIICTEKSIDLTCGPMYSYLLNVVKKYNLHKILTSVELKLYKAGVDVRMNGDTYKERLKNLKENDK